METRSVGCLVLCVVAACSSSGFQSAPAPARELADGPIGLELLEISRVESSPAEGKVVLRVANTAPGPILLGIDVRAEPGMWLAPARQETALFYVPPEGERTVSVGYAFAHLSPEATLHVRVGVPEEHAGGWVHIPEPVAVRHFDLGSSEAARAFLDRFDRRATPHLAIYAVRGMFSSEQLDTLAAARDHAIAELSRMLDVPPPPGITLVFYPDAASKTADTDHVGAGMTRGSTLAEIFTDSVRLDPYHELAHVMSGQLGWAPAWLNEGFAIYASEYLGADALVQQGSAGKTVDQAACEFRLAGELLPTADLMRLPDIGPEGTRPHVTYAQAASFTGFLAQRFGLPPLRTAFATLSPMASAEENETAFAQAFGVSSEDAAELWSAYLDEICPLSEAER
jgi:hypothetical protein